MQDTELKAILTSKIQNSLGYQGGKLAKERQTALQYYRGEPFGNEVDGRSQVVSRDVAEAVDSTMPALVKIFAGTDEVGKFEPQEPKDEAASEQATDYVNYIYNRENPGYTITSTVLFDGLLQKNGVAKSWWDTQETVETEEYQGLSLIQLIQLVSDPDVELIEQSVNAPEAPLLDPSQSGAPANPLPGSAPGGSPSMAPAMGQPAPQALPAVQPMPPEPTYNAKIKRTNKTGRVCVVPVPPEEFLIDRRAVSLEDTTFCAHRFKRTVTDLLEDGYAKSLVDTLPGNDEIDYNLEKLERYRPEDEMPYRSQNTLDPAMREIWYCECYIKIALDGNRATWHKIIVAGGDGGYEILDKEEVDGHPFTAWTPNPQPHKFFGMSMADKTKDIQLIKSTVWRQTLDNLYISNVPQLGVVANQVNLDDLLTRRPGGVIRMSSPNAIVPLPTQPMAAETFPMINYLDSVRENRTGIRRFTSSTDADALNPYNNTATGAQLVEDSSQDRILLIARNFAEQFMKPLYQRIFALTCKYQQKSKVIRLRGKWVEIDPSTWNTKMDFTITVGLGTGNRNQQIQQSTMMLSQIAPLIVQAQGGVNGPVLTWKNVYKQLEKFGSSLGYKSIDGLYTDPDTAPPQQPQPNPELVKAQAQMQLEQMKAQQQLELKKQEAGLNAQLDLQKAQLQAQIEQVQAQADIEVQRQKAAVDMEIAKQKAMFQAQVDAARASTDMAEKQREGAAKREQVKVNIAGSEHMQGVAQTLAQMAEQQRQANEAHMQAIGAMLDRMNKPRKIVRDKNNRVVGVE